MTRLAFLMILLGFLAPVVYPQTESEQLRQAEAQKHLARGIEILIAKETRKALAEFEQAIALDENLIEAQMEFQDHSLEIGDRPALVAAYRRKAADNPQNPAFHFLLARLIDGEEAVRALARSVSLDANFFWGYTVLARYYFVSDREKGEAALQAAVRTCPESGVARAYLARTFYDLGRFDQALAEFEKAQALGINDHLKAIVGGRLNQISGIRTFNFIAFLAYLVAALIFTAVLVGTIKEALMKPSRQGADGASVFFLIFSSAWFYILFLMSAQGQIPFVGPGRNSGILGLLMALWCAFWPAVVYHLVFREKFHQIPLHKIYPRFVYYFYASGIVLAGVFGYGWLGLQQYRFASSRSLISWGFALFMGNFIFCGLLSFIIATKVNRALKAAREEPEVKSSRRWEILIWAAWLFVLWPVLIAITFGVISIKEYERYLSLLGTLMPLPFLLVGIYYEARYLFIDLFIKRGIVIIVTALTAALYYVQVVEKFAQGPVWKGIKYPSLLILLPLIIAIPFLAAGVERIIDRYIFRRKFSPAEALSGFSHAIRFSADEAQLAQRVKERLTEIFSTQNVMVAFAEDGGLFSPLKEALLRTGDPVLSNEIQNSEIAGFCKQKCLEAIVPLVVGEKLSGYITLGKRFYKEPYLSEDLKLLRSLADHVVFALENIRLERQRRAHELKGQELKLLAGKAELRALRAQINPHFLFNALNTIAALIRKDPQKAEGTVETLSDVFRYTLARSETDFIPLSEEIDFINAYLEVEKVRFGNKLKIEMKIDPQSESLKIPAMLLQPLVENSIKHGISQKVEGGKIIVSSQCVDGFLELEVADDGPGFDDSRSTRLYKDGVGLKNVRDRLQALYGTEEGLQIHSCPHQGTTVAIQIPISSLER